MNGWRAWFSLHCQHAYFADGRWPGLRVQPSAASAAWLAARGLRFQPNADGGVLWAPEGDDSWAADAEQAQLHFWLSGVGGDWLYYTALAQPATLGLWCFDSRQCRPRNSGALNAAGPLAAPCLPAMPWAFDWPVNPPVQTAALSLIDPLAARGAPPVWQALSPAARLARLPLRISGVAEGRYQLLVNDAQALDAWFGPCPADAWGVLTVDAPRPSSARQPGKVYQLQLSAASRHWRYQVLGDAATLADCQLTVQDSVSGQTLTFSDQGPVQTAGRSGRLWRSPAPLTLAQQAGARYQPRLRAANGALDIPLPCPPPDARAPDASSELEWLVYL